MALLQQASVTLRWSCRDTSRQAERERGGGEREREREGKEGSLKFNAQGFWNLEEKDRVPN